MEGNGEWIPVKDKRSLVWKHLLVRRSDKKVVKCKYCENVFKDAGSTSSFKYHLEQKHKINLTESGVPPSQKSVSDFFPKKKASPGEVAAKLAAVDRISFKTLANSEEIRKGWEAQGLSMPTSDQGIRYYFKVFAAVLSWINLTCFLQVSRHQLWREEES